MELLMHYIYQVLLITIAQLLILFGPGIFFAILMNLLSQKISEHACMLFGKRIYLGLFGWLGTVSHEIGHAIFCILFGHKIHEIKLFDPDEKSGHLGFVSHSYNNKKIYPRIGNFFIAVGPILFGSTIIYIASYWLFGSELNGRIKPFALDSNLDIVLLVQNSFVCITHNIKGILSLLLTPRFLFNWKLYLVLYIVFSIGSSMRLSAVDLTHAYSGLRYIVGLFFLINFFTFWLLLRFSETIDLYIFYFSQYYSFFYSIMVFSIIMNAIAAFFFFVLIRLFHCCPKDEKEKCSKLL